jgi:CubicO group peptidase (beta-lactamase class C family)
MNPIFRIAVRVRALGRSLRRDRARALPALLLVLAGADAIAQDYDAIDADLRAGRYGPVNSLLVEHRGRLVFERYYRGHARDDLQLLNSITKSVGSALVGIAHRRGLVDPDDTIESWLPDYDWSRAPYAAHRSLRLEHVLQMRHGFDWDEWSHGFTDSRNHAVQMFASPDWYAYTLARPRAAPAGSRFGYSTGSSVLLGAVLREAAGESPQTLFQRWLGTPLGIARFDWELWNPRGPGYGQREFPFDEAPLGVGLWLRPLDLLKLGRLYRDRGVYEGRRLLDAEWIDASWTRHSDAGTDAYFAQGSERTGYGYLWWFREFVDVNGGRHACWNAEGAGRQYLIVCPRDDLIVVSTGDAYQYTAAGVFTLLREKILPALTASPDASRSGFYYDPATSGQGLSIEVLEERGQAIAAWYTFAHGRQRWYAMLGRIDGDRIVFESIQRLEGGEFLVPATLQPVDAGHAELRFSGCDRAELDYDLELGRGHYALSRIASDCAAAAASSGKRPSVSGRRRHD